jgi:hypothetical protein
MLRHKLKEETIVNILNALNSQILNPMRLTLYTNDPSLKYEHDWIKWEHNVNPGWFFLFLNFNK